MNILLTNDDGISSEGILRLAEALRSRGKHRIYIIAPDSNRSGVSHAISMINAPAKLSHVGEDTWSCSGTPVDCIIVALLGGLQEKPDLVLSGINRGANLGTDIIYSGTAAGARQASIMGIPAVALSLAAYSDLCWDMASAWTAEHLDELTAFCGEDTFVNVNIPNNPGGPDGIKMTWPAVKHYGDTLSQMAEKDGSRWCFLEFGDGYSEKEPGSDCDAVSRNFVSVSPVRNHPVVREDLCPGAPAYASAAKRETWI